MPTPWKSLGHLPSGTSETHALALSRGRPQSAWPDGAYTGDTPDAENPPLAGVFESRRAQWTPLGKPFPHGYAGQVCHKGRTSSCGADAGADLLRVPLSAHAWFECRRIRSVHGRSLLTARLVHRRRARRVPAVPGSSRSPRPPRRRGGLYRVWRDRASRRDLGLDVARVPRHHGRPPLGSEAQAEGSARR